MQSVSFGIFANMILQTIWMSGPWTNKMDYIFMLYFLFFFRYRITKMRFYFRSMFIFLPYQTNESQEKKKRLFVNPVFILFEYHLNCLWTIKVILMKEVLMKSEITPVTGFEIQNEQFYEQFFNRISLIQRLIVTIVWNKLIYCYFITFYVLF